MPWLRKLSIKTAGYINIAALTLTICVHLLVIFGVLPFTWVNGVRSESFEGALQLSIVSISILVVMIGINAWTAGIVRLQRFERVLKVLLWLLFVYSLIGLVQQLAGTAFEKAGMSILCLITAAIYLRLATANSRQRYTA